MARYDILKDFKGSQDGTQAEDFTKGTTREVSDYLAAAVEPGSIRLAKDQSAPETTGAEIENKAIVSAGTSAERKPKAKKSSKKRK